MKPIDFPEANTTFAANQPQYIPLPAYTDDEGRAISCWELTPEERQKIAETGILWLHQLTFGEPLQPILPTVDYPFVQEQTDDTIRDLDNDA